MTLVPRWQLYFPGSRKALPIARRFLVGQLDLIPAATALVGALIAAVTDVTRFKVHNLLTLPLFVTGLIYHGLTGGAHGLAGSMLSAALGFAFLVTFYAMGGVGAGDVKLLAAIGAWLGMPFTFYVFLASALAAGVYAVVLIVLWGNLRETWARLQIIWHRVVAIGKHLGADDRVESEVRRDDRRRRVIPFAAMTFLGLVAFLVWSWVNTRP
jgi:prepilin peptidase CpaA